MQCYMNPTCNACRSEPGFSGRRLIGVSAPTHSMTVFYQPSIPSRLIGGKGREGGLKQDMFSSISGLTVSRSSIATCSSHSTSDYRSDGLPQSMYARYTKLPPEGKTLTEEEETCRPEERTCKTPIMVWESKCKACYGTGMATSSGKHRNAYTCVSCNGIGYLRRSSVRLTPNLSNGSMTLGRLKPGEEEGQKDPVKSPYMPAWLRNGKLASAIEKLEKKGS